MRRVLFCAVLLLSLPAVATISQVQSKANFGNTAATCQVTFTTQNPTPSNMIAVWTSWTTSGTNSVTASVSDQLKNGTCNSTGQCFYPSAVGPTVQSASSTAAQILYAVIAHGNASDPVTVTFSSAPSSSSCVIVEYSGLDPNYPLDSSSASYSYSAGGYMDSGTAVPANANLLVFGGGVNSNNTLPSPGSGFTSVQSNAATGSITEQFINSTASPNNVLQRATAALSGAGTGNWVMQMAVFRAGSWGLTNGSPVLPGGSFADGNFAGSAYHCYFCQNIGGFTFSSLPIYSAYKYLDTIAGGCIMPSNAANPSLGNCNGIAGYAITNADSRNGGSGLPGVADNVASFFGVSICNANNSGCWGLNPAVDDVAGISGQKMVLFEGDIGVDTAGTANSIHGIDLLYQTNSPSGAMPSNSAALYVQCRPAGSTTCNLADGLVLQNGTTNEAAGGIGLLLGTSAWNASANVPSQAIQFCHFDNSPTPTQRCSDIMYDDGLGNLIVQANLGGIKLNSPIAVGTVSATGTGACATITSTAGGGWAGTLTCTGTTNPSTIVITPGITAPHGFSCGGSDLTTAANILRQSAVSAATCTIAGAVNANDVLTFFAFAY
jgi:hypothetical protein